MRDQAPIPVSQLAQATPRDYLRVALPSAIGVALFLVPLRYGGDVTIVMGVITSTLQALIGDRMAWFTTPIFLTGALLSVAFTLGPRSLATRFPYLHEVFETNGVWLTLRVVAGIGAPMTALTLGPAWVHSAETGGTAYVEIGGLIFLIIGVACLLLPFLTEFGLLEFVGTLMRRPFKRMFNLPGRATVDTLASWVGASSVAILVTVRQYESGFYSEREAAVISTNFSVVSIPFVVLISQVAGIGEHFVPLYASMVVVGLTCALITPRLPPLSRLPDTYYAPVGRQIHEETSSSSPFAWAVQQSVTRARNAPRPVAMLKRSLKVLFDIFFTMMPAAMAIEFIALVAYHHTRVLQLLTQPLIPLLSLLQIPEAAAAAPGVVVGLLDQFVPALIAGTIDNQTASFLLAGLSVTQLIFFAESAVLILNSSIPLSLGQLISIFCLRTVIALPMLAIAAHWLI